MKRLIATLVAVTGMTTVAMASDMPSSRNNNYYAPASTFNWAGFYAGLNAGYGWNASDDTKVNDYYGPLTYGSTKKSDGFTGGLQVGYNFQSGNIIYGLEADINFANIKSRNSGFGNYVGKWETYSVKSETSWFGTIRPRVGFAVSDRFMVFATGGLAFGEVKIDGGSTIGGYGSLSGKNSDIRWGWTLGAGVEYAITDNLTVKGEYAYVDLADKTQVWQGRYGWNNLNVKDAPSLQILRAGMNYKF